MPNANRARVLLLIPHLGGGGAEHVTELLARHLDRSKYEIHLALATLSSECLRDSFGGIVVHELNASRIRYSALKLLRLLWDLKPKAIVSGMAHLNLLVLLLRPTFPKQTLVLVRQNGPLSATVEACRFPNVWRWIYGWAYRRADLVICQSESMAQEIKQELQVHEKRIKLLPNPVDSELIRHIGGSCAYSFDSRQYLLAVGRLVPEKGFDILLEAFAALADRFADVHLVIAGSGRLEAALREQAVRLGIAEGVRFTGHVSNPAVLFGGARLYVLSSRVEGVPNALLEAAAAGLPIVATPASGGVSELLADHEGVWLADETSAKALRAALETALQAVEPGQRCPHSWIEAFDIARAIPAYEAAIDRAMEGAAK
jgi:glycosyltransferase involved in cell wall biosynthesis